MSHKLLDPFQIGFGKKQETACVRVTNDLLISADSVHLNILILLDLSAAFGMVHHPMLKEQVDNTVGVHGLVFTWPQCYLSNGQQLVTVNGKLSSSITTNS